MIPKQQRHLARRHAEGYRLFRDPAALLRGTDEKEQYGPLLGAAVRRMFGH